MLGNETRKNRAVALIELSKRNFFSGLPIIANALLAKVKIQCLALKRKSGVLVLVVNSIGRAIPKATGVIWHPGKAIAIVALKLSHA